MPNYIINKDISADSKGKIKLLSLNSIESKKDLVDLYFTINLGEIPYSDYGNTLLEKIYDVMDDDYARDIVTKLIGDLSLKFGFKIKKYKYTIDYIKRFLSVIIILSSDEIIEFIDISKYSGNKSDIIVDRVIDYFPIPGNNGIIEFTKSGTDLIINWTVASTNYDYSKRLQYQVYLSNISNIDSLNNIDINGTIIEEWTEDIIEYIYEDVIPGLYYFNIVVKDYLGFKAIYQMNNYNFI